MDFRGNFTPVDVRDIMRKNGIKVTALNYDVYARDFTVNSLLYDFINNKIYDITGMGVKDVENKTLKTIFDPEEILPRNPLIITRAIIMALRGYTIVPELSDVMMSKSDDLFSGSISGLRLAYEYDKIIKYEKGNELLKDYGLFRLKNVWKEAKKQNPKLFEGR